LHARYVFHVQEWSAAVSKHLEELGKEAPDPEEVKIKVVESAKEHPLYGTNFFNVRKKAFPPGMDHFPDDLIITLNSDGLSILTSVNEAPLITYGYADVYRWGGSSTQFSIIVWNAELEATEDVTFYTSQAADMAGLILDYINAIMASDSAY
jgi:hypothetical protein